MQGEPLLVMASVGSSSLGQSGAQVGRVEGRGWEALLLWAELILQLKPIEPRDPTTLTGVV